MSKKNKTPSAVLVLHERKTDCLILTRRSEDLKTQPGEICFPGGYQEKQDVDLQTTALRELNEELGVSASRVKMIREMKPDHTLYHAVIYPWLAEIVDIEPYQLNLKEVSELIKTPMREVKNADNYVQRPMKRYGMSFDSVVYTASDALIWGVTARIMHQLTTSP